VEVNFENSADSFKMNITIPPNSQSDVYVPLNFQNYTLMHNGEAIQGEEQDKFVLVRDVKPGSHSFELTRIL
jgi:LEA14-like dessication related protein